MEKHYHDYVVVGGGLVGAAIAEDLARNGSEVAILDQGDIAFRAARGNFGHVWVPGKGANSGAYADLTRRSAQDWERLADRLWQTTGIDVEYDQCGGLIVCFSDAELDHRKAIMERTEALASVKSEHSILDAQQVCEIVPTIGSDVVGGVYTPDGGSANPLNLLRALLASGAQSGCKYFPDVDVERITFANDAFTMISKTAIHKARHVILCAGLGNATLAPQIGLYGEVRPVRGQIMVTEKIDRFLDVSTSFVRQTRDGGCLIGESTEEVGFDTETTASFFQSAAQKATAAFPGLANVRVLRTWSALRVMSKDGLPIYHLKRFGESGICTGAAISVHSGVTLAPFHAESLAKQIKRQALDSDIEAAFSPERFNV